MDKYPICKFNCEYTNDSLCEIKDLIELNIYDYTIENTCLNSGLKYDCVYDDGLITWIYYNYKNLIKILQNNIILTNLYKLKKIIDDHCESKITCQEIAEIFDLITFPKIHHKNKLDICFIFEILSGLIIKKEQIQKFNEIICNYKEKQIDQNNKYNIYHFMMGKGKSSVITPLLAIFLNVNCDSIINIIIPDHLISQTNDTMFMYEYFYKIKNLIIQSDNDAKQKLINNKFLNNEIFIFDEFDSMYDPIQSNYNVILESNNCISSIPNLYDTIWNFMIRPHKLTEFNEELDKTAEENEINLSTWFNEFKHIINLSCLDNTPSFLSFTDNLL